MWHTVFIALHAVAALVALAAGCAAITLPALLPTYLWSLVAQTVFVAVAVGLDWGGLGLAPRILFTALVALGCYMVWRAVRARAVAPDSRAQRPSSRYLDHLGFTLVALLDGFLIILVLDLGGPGWAAAVVGVAVAVGGHFAIRGLKTTLTRPT